VDFRCRKWRFGRGYIHHHHLIKLVGLTEVLQILLHALDGLTWRFMARQIGEISKRRNRFPHMQQGSRTNVSRPCFQIFAAAGQPFAGKNPRPLM
jgi:hypothetical protein